MSFSTSIQADEELGFTSLLTTMLPATYLSVSYDINAEHTISHSPSPMPMSLPMCDYHSNATLSLSSHSSTPSLTSSSLGSGSVSPLASVSLGSVSPLVPFLHDSMMTPSTSYINTLAFDFPDSNEDNTLLRNLTSELSMIHDDADHSFTPINTINTINDMDNMTSINDDLQSHDSLSVAFSMTNHSEQNSMVDELDLEDTHSIDSFTSSVDTSFSSIASMSSISAPASDNNTTSAAQNTKARVLKRKSSSNSVTLNTKKRSKKQQNSDVSEHTARDDDEEDMVEKSNTVSAQSLQSLTNAPQDALQHQFRMGIYFPSMRYLQHHLVAYSALEAAVADLKTSHATLSSPIDFDQVLANHRKQPFDAVLERKYCLLIQAMIALSRLPYKKCKTRVQKVERFRLSRIVHHLTPHEEHSTRSSYARTRIRINGRFVKSTDPIAATADVASTAASAPVLAPSAAALQLKRKLQQNFGKADSSSLIPPLHPLSSLSSMSSVLKSELSASFHDKAAALLFDASSPALITSEASSLVATKSTLPTSRMAVFKPVRED